MSRTEWTALLNEARTTHESYPELSAFCPFPEDLEPCDVAPHRINPAILMETDRALDSAPLAAFRDAFVTCSPHAGWRETYRGTSIGEDFLNRFGCYELFGKDGAFRSAQSRSFVVYATPGLYYPWHHHPAEELYLIVAGEAEFHLEGEGSRLMRPGDTVFHPAGRPHAMTTHDKPVMAYVMWRGDLETAPVLTDRLNAA